VFTKLSFNDETLGKQTLLAHKI